MGKRNNAGAGTTSSSSKRRRTGATRRARGRRLGRPRPISEADVTSAAEAKRYWLEVGRGALGKGMSMRVDPQTDLDAFEVIAQQCAKHAKVLRERLAPVLIEGVAEIAGDLGRLLGFAPQLADDAGAKGAAPEPPAPSDDELLLAAFNFVSSRRKGIAKVAKGPANAEVRRAFGIHRRVAMRAPASIPRALTALLAGRIAKPRTMAARQFTPADVKAATGYLASFTALRKRRAAERAGKQKASRETRLAHAALEIFYDRYLAACEVAIEDDTLRIEAQQLVPRRPSRGSRAKVAVAPAAVAGDGAATRAAGG